MWQKRGRNMPTKEDRKIEDLGIYELRVLARQVGVKSPTSKKREELLAAIKNIIEGKEDPYKRKDGRGRPTKMTATLDEFSNVLVPSNLNYDMESDHEDYILTKDFDKSFVLMQQYASYVEDSDHKNMSVEGIVDTNRMGVYILRTQSYDYSSDDVFISNQFVQDGKLVVGDHILGEAAFGKGQKTRALVRIDQLNGKDYAEFCRCEPNLSSSNTTKAYHIKQQEVAVGKRSLWLYKDRQHLNEKAIEVYQNLQEKKVHVFNLNLNNLDCDQMFDTGYYHYIPVAFVKEVSSVYLATKLTFERANVLAKQGEQVLIIFSSISSYLKTAYKSGDEQKNKVDHVMHELKEYFSYSKSFDNGGSITILCLENEMLPAGIKNVIDYELIDIFHEVHYIA